MTDQGGKRVRVTDPGIYNTEEEAARAGKRDGYCKAVGSFAVARMSGGLYEYFPHGQPAHERGEPDPGAEWVSRYGYYPTSPRWRRLWPADDVDYEERLREVEGA